jgi:hypothetical protein
VREEIETLEDHADGGALPRDLAVGEIDIAAVDELFAEQAAVDVDVPEDGFSR